MQSWELNRSVPSVIRAHVFNHVYTTLVGKGDTQTEVDCLQKTQQELRLARLWEGSEGKEPGNERKGEIERRGSREKWKQLKRAVISKGIHQAIETPAVATAKRLKGQAALNSLWISLLYRTLISFPLSTNFQEPAFCSWHFQTERK